MADSNTPPVAPTSPPAPAGPTQGTQSNPTVTTPARRPTEHGLTQTGVIMQMRREGLERAKAAGRAAQQVENAQRAAFEAAMTATIEQQAGVANPPVAAPAPVVAQNSAPASGSPPTPAPTALTVSQPGLTTTAGASLAPAPAPAPTFVNKQVEVSWNTIREAEKQVADARAALSKEREVWKADQSKPAQELAAFQQALRTDPITTLGKLGLSPQQLANTLIQAHSGAPSAPTPSAPPPAPSYTPFVSPTWATPPAPSAPAYAPPPEVTALQQQLNETRAQLQGMQGVLVQKFYNDELSKPDYAVLRTAPDAVDRALQIWTQYKAATGKDLTIGEACGRAQEELITIKRAEFAALSGDPAWQKALDLKTAPAPMGSAPASQTPSANPSAQGITSLSSDLAPGGYVPPVTQRARQQYLPPEQERRQRALQRAQEAAERAVAR